VSFRISSEHPMTFLFRGVKTVSWSTDGIAVLNVDGFCGQRSHIHAFTPLPRAEELDQLDGRFATL
jgi:hypothetical protein